MAATLGAAHAVAPGTAIEAAVLAATDGVGADAVFDTVGGPATLAAGLAVSRQGGTVVLFAHAADGARADFDLNNLFKYERRILGTYSGALREQAQVFDLICDGALDPSPLVTHRLPLDRFGEGVDLVRRHQALKILFTPSVGAGTS